MGNNHSRYKPGKKSHNDYMNQVIRLLVVRRFESSLEVADFFLHAMTTSRSIDDIYGELLVWESRRYEDART